MPRYNDMPERDSHGRFVSDDDHRGYGRHGGSTYRERDRYGRFMSENGHNGRYSSRHDEDDRRYSSHRDDDYGREHSHGGWFGDPRGHSEASRRGWEHRREDDGRGSYSRSSSRYEDDDDDRRSSRGHYDDYSHDRGQGGWFGDHEGHSEASRRGWEYRRGQDERGTYGRSSSRYGDDDRRYSRHRDDDHSRDHGQGGWFGDYEGHSEASRRGWDNRRR